jgi:hypothetical protein
VQPVAATSFITPPIRCNFASLTRQRGGEAAMIMKQGARTDLAQICAMSQRALIAARMATMKQGARTDLAPIGAMSQEGAATMLNVSRRSVQRANVVVLNAPIRRCSNLSILSLSHKRLRPMLNVSRRTVASA